MDFIHQHLQRLRKRQLLRRPVVVESLAEGRVNVDGRELLVFCSNNYLALADDPRVKAAAVAAIQRYGFGATASRLIVGTTELHRRLESELARFLGTEAALVFSSGYAANLAVVRALVGKGDLICLDKLSHASLIDAAQASGATVRIWPHGNVEKLRRLLQRGVGFRRRLILCDSLYSMDGDLAPVVSLVELKRRYDAMLVLDEAHAFGCLGPAGRGVAEMSGVSTAVDAIVATLSKALGSVGGFVAGSAELIELLASTARSFIYTTAPPAAACAAALEALRIVQAEPDRRGRLQSLAELLRAGLKRHGIDTGDSCSHIVPVIVGEVDAAMDVSGRLLEQGFLIPAIRPPSVPRGSARLRISLMATHEPQHVQRLVDVLGRLAEAGRLVRRRGRKGAAP